MEDKSKVSREHHTQIILDRYADRENITVHKIAPDVLVERYLSKIMMPKELEGKTILELGAGCSTYVPVFLSNGCRKYYANDLIPQRLEAIRVPDARYVEIPGDFRTVVVPEKVDIAFANLVMMFVMPMLDEFVEKIREVLKVRGVFASMDPNYLCPLSIYRRFADRMPNPVRLFNPFRYADIFLRNGFEIEKLVPFTAALPLTTGNWVLGTTFWMRARKK
jgi:SAM-dependent methyltransferase